MQQHHEGHHHFHHRHRPHNRHHHISPHSRRLCKLLNTKDVFFSERRKSNHTPLLTWPLHPPYQRPSTPFRGVGCGYSSRTKPRTVLHLPPMAPLNSTLSDYNPRPSKPIMPDLSAQPSRENRGRFEIPESIMGHNGSRQSCHALSRDLLLRLLCGARVVSSWKIHF